MFQIDPGRLLGELMPLENQVPNQEIDGPHAMLPLVPAKEQTTLVAPLHAVSRQGVRKHSPCDAEETKDATLKRPK